jgi:hypothetical protein
VDVSVATGWRNPGVVRPAAVEVVPLTTYP